MHLHNECYALIIKSQQLTLPYRSSTKPLENMKETFQECKEEIAKLYMRKSWYNLMHDTISSNGGINIKTIHDLEKYLEQAAERYALQFQTPIESVNNCIITDSDGKKLTEGQDYKIVPCFPLPEID